MNVRRICFVGMHTLNAQANVDFFRDVVGLPTAFEKPDWTGLQLPTGARDFFEIFGPGEPDPRFFPPNLSQGLLVAFLVDDLVAARAELETAGTELIGDLVWVSEPNPDNPEDAFGWCFFRAPDGNVYCLQQDGVPRDD